MISWVGQLRQKEAKILLLIEQHVEIENNIKALERFLDSSRNESIEIQSTKNIVHWCSAPLKAKVRELLQTELDSLRKSLVNLTHTNLDEV